MPWSVEKILDTEIIRIHYSGLVTMADVSASTEQALALARADMPSRFLNTFKDAELKLNTLELSNIPSMWEMAKANWENRLAIVKPSSGIAEDLLNFFQVNARSMGWKVLVLNELNHAVDWLTQNE